MSLNFKTNKFKYDESNKWYHCIMFGCKYGIKGNYSHDISSRFVDAYYHIFIALNHCIYHLSEAFLRKYLLIVIKFPRKAWKYLLWKSNHCIYHWSAFNYYSMFIWYYPCTQFSFGNHNNINHDLMYFIAKVYSSLGCFIHKEINMNISDHHWGDEYWQNESVSFAVYF